MNYWTSVRRGAVMAALPVLIFGMGAKTGLAFPKFSQKEKKPCSYCHVTASGGGKRNAAGKWYQQHGLSFAGYTPEKAAKEAGAGAAATGVKKPSSPVKKSSATAKKPAPKKPAPKKSVKK